MVGDILVTEGVNAGGSYSVLQLMVKGGDVEWAGGATRVPKTIGITPRADVKAIVDAANAQVAPILTQKVGTQANDITRDPNRKAESEMGNMVADALRAKYPEAEAAWTNSGGLRVDFPFASSSAGEGDGVITAGEMFALLPFGNATVIETLTGAQVKASFVNGFSAVCNTAINTGRFPQVSGLVVTYHCNGTTAVVDGVWKAPNGPSGTKTPLADGDTLRFVTNDFMLTGGDGYTLFIQGTNVKFTGDLMLDVVTAYVTAHPNIDPLVEGRITVTP